MPLGSPITGRQRGLFAVAAASIVAVYSVALAIGTEKGFLPKLVNLNRLFSVFWLAVFVVLPAAAAASPRLRTGLASAGLPVPPLWAGGLFLTSDAISKILAFVHAGTIRAHALDELMEASYAAIYLGIALAALAAELRTTRTRAEAGTGKSPDDGAQA